MDEQTNTQTPTEQPQEQPTQSAQGKKFPIIPVIIGIVVLLIIAGDIYFFVSEKLVTETLTPLAPTDVTPPTEEPVIEPIVSSYGFSFTVPEGWRIWEGGSASSELIIGTDFLSDMESGFTEENYKEYQRFMDDWSVETAKIITFTNNSDIDYKDRDLAEAGKIQSTRIDSAEVIEENETKMFISNKPVDLELEISNVEKVETKYIEIDGNTSSLQIGKPYKLVDMVIISTPIDSTKTIDGGKVQSLSFIKYVKKGDRTAINDLISFIEALDVSANP